MLVPLALSPLITSQYVPSANEVTNVAVHDESMLFIAMNPAEPRIPHQPKHQKKNDIEIGRVEEMYLDQMRSVEVQTTSNS